MTELTSAYNLKKLQLSAVELRRLTKWHPKVVEDYLIQIDALVETMATVDGLLPSGAIIIWSGAVAAIPTGWFLCNGSNGTPDLRDKFVLGAGTTAVGTIGANTKAEAEALTLTTANLPSHRHDIEAAADHGGHSNANVLVASGALSARAGNIDRGGHSHTGATGYVGSGTALNVSPPYYALAYIMKA